MPYMHSRIGEMYYSSLAIGNEKTAGTEELLPFQCKRNELSAMDSPGMNPRLRVKAKLNKQ